jgi:hypothetical protein
MLTNGNFAVSCGLVRFSFVAKVVTKFIPPTKLTLNVKVTGGSGERIAWGDWGEAVMLEPAYKHPRTRQKIQIRQAVRIARQQPFELTIGARGSVVCWGVMPSGMLRHPLFLSWS